MRQGDPEQGGVSAGITVLCRQLPSGQRLIVARCNECGIVAERITDGDLLPAALRAVEFLFYAGCRHAAHSAHAARVPTLPDLDDESVR